MKRVKKHKKCEINFINGVELSSITKINGRNQWLHILGYGYDNTNDNLISVLNEKRKLRYDVNKKYLIDLKNELSFINDNIFDKIVCNKYITLSRLINKYLDENPYKKEQLEKIKKYIENIKPKYPNYELEAKDAITLIINAGGYPILAHPYQYHLTKNEEILLLRELKNYGLVGIEKFHSGDTLEGMIMQDEICQMFDFEWTVGSDFHTDYDDFGNEIGYGKNNNLCKETCSLIKKLEGKIQRV